MSHSCPVCHKMSRTSQSLFKIFYKNDKSLESFIPKPSLSVKIIRTSLYIFKILLLSMVKLKYYKSICDVRDMPSLHN